MYHTILREMIWRFITGTTKLFSISLQKLLIVFPLCNPSSNIWKLGRIFTVWSICLFITHFLLHLMKKEILNAVFNRCLFIPQRRNKINKSEFQNTKNTVYKQTVLVPIYESHDYRLSTEFKVLTKTRIRVE